MSTQTKEYIPPTEQARKAAESVCKNRHLVSYTTGRELAELIDLETDLPVLLATNAAQAAEIERLRGALEEIAAADHCSYKSFHDGQCPTCVARAALTRPPSEKSGEGKTS